VNHEVSPVRHRAPATDRGAALRSRLADVNADLLSRWAGVVRRRVITQCGVAVLAVGVTTAAGVIFAPEIARRYLFLAYFPSLLVSASLGGLVSGITALVGIELAVWGYWLPLDPGGYRPRLGDLGPVAVFLVTGAALAWLMEQLHRAQERLEVALQRERADSATKDAFLASLSHELRTPLNVVQCRHAAPPGGTAARHAADHSRSVRAAM
jgi:signal transduction histidine kinase